MPGSDYMKPDFTMIFIMADRFLALGWNMELEKKIRNRTDDSDVASRMPHDSLKEMSSMSKFVVFFD